MSSLFSVSIFLLVSTTICQFPLSNRLSFGRLLVDAETAYDQLSQYFLLTSSRRFRPSMSHGPNSPFSGAFSMGKAQRCMALLILSISDKPKLVSGVFTHSSPLVPAPMSLRIAKIKDIPFRELWENLFTSQLHRLNLVIMRISFVYVLHSNPGDCKSGARTCFSKGWVSRREKVSARAGLVQPCRPFEEGPCFYLLKPIRVCCQRVLEVPRTGELYTPGGENRESIEQGVLNREADRLNFVQRARAWSI